MGGGHELEDRRRVVERDDHAARTAQRAAQARRRRERGRPPRRPLPHGDARAAADWPAALPRGDRLLAARGQLERRIVGGPHGRAPGKSWRWTDLRPEPLPFAGSTWTSRPRWSRSMVLIEVLPPPQTTSEVSAPIRREA